MSVLIRFAPASLPSLRIASSYCAAVNDAPDGRDYHVCFGEDGNLRVSEIWDSREQFAAFGERLMPILAEVGIDPGKPEFIEVHKVSQR